jgi:hypothetical protein
VPAGTTRRRSVEAFASTERRAGEDRAPGREQRGSGLGRLARGPLALVHVAQEVVPGLDLVLARLAVRPHHVDELEQRLGQSFTRTGRDLDEVGPAWHELAGDPVAVRLAETGRGDDRDEERQPRLGPDDRRQAERVRDQRRDAGERGTQDGIGRPLARAGGGPDALEDRAGRPEGLGQPWGALRLRPGPWRVAEPDPDPGLERPGGGRPVAAVLEDAVDAEGAMRTLLQVRVRGGEHVHDAAGAHGRRGPRRRLARPAQVRGALLVSVDERPAVPLKEFLGAGLHVRGRVVPVARSVAADLGGP